MDIVKAGFRKCLQVEEHKAFLCALGRARAVPEGFPQPLVPKSYFRGISAPVHVEDNVEAQAAPLRDA